MNDYLKVYHAKLRVKGPVFVGSGEKLLKKEYILSEGRSRINVLDQLKAYWFFRSKGLTTAYEQFMIEDPRSDLFHFLKDNNLSINDIKQCFRYSLDAGDALKDNDRKREILAFVKDPFGNPYVPGSSIKGMLRSILLDYDIMLHQDKYLPEKNTIDLEECRNKKRYLSKSVTNVEAKAFNTLNRNAEKKTDALNDRMSGIVISDSAPLSVNDLVICKKIDLHTDGKESGLPIARECLSPGTVIKFDISIDSTVADISGDYIIKAINAFDEMYNRCFLDKFRMQDILKSNEVYLGGGCGFVTKTFIYPMFGEKGGLNTTVKILNAEFDNKHRQDKSENASPRVLKCTRYEGQLMQMGLCEFSLE